MAREAWTGAQGQIPGLGVGRAGQQGLQEGAVVWTQSCSEPGNAGEAGEDEGRG